MWGRTTAGAAAQSCAKARCRARFLGRERTCAGHAGRWRASPGRRGRGREAGARSVGRHVGATCAEELEDVGAEGEADGVIAGEPELASVMVGAAESDERGERGEANGLALASDMGAQVASRLGGAGGVGRMGAKDGFAAEDAAAAFDALGAREVFGLADGFGDHRGPRFIGEVLEAVELLGAQRDFIGHEAIVGLASGESAVVLESARSPATGRSGAGRDALGPPRCHVVLGTDRRRVAGRWARWSVRRVAGVVGVDALRISAPFRRAVHAHADAAAVAASRAIGIGAAEVANLDVLLVGHVALSVAVEARAPLSVAAHRGNLHAAEVARRLVHERERLAAWGVGGLADWRRRHCCSVLVARGRSVVMPVPRGMRLAVRVLRSGAHAVWLDGRRRRAATGICQRDRQHAQSKSCRIFSPAATRARPALARAVALGRLPESPFACDSDANARHGVCEARNTGWSWPPLTTGR